MWPWIRRSRDWLMRNLWPLSRTAARPLALNHHYERAGLTVSDQPIPWTAESLLVEADFRLPPGVPRRKADFTLQLTNQSSFAAEQLRRVGGDDHYRATFRLPPPRRSDCANLYHRGYFVARHPLPVVSREEFLRALRLEMPTLSVQLGAECVACETFVCRQCKGLLASGMLISPTSLVPLLDLDLQVEFRCERSGSSFRTPASLTSSQLAGSSTLVTVVPRRYPRRIGTWTATWLVGDHVLARQRIRAISQKQFQRSLRIFDTRFVVQSGGNDFTLCRNNPPPGSGARVGPCFLVASAEPGMAGLCKLQVSAVVPDAIRPPLLLEQQVLITDGPTMVAPGTLDEADLVQVAAFDLCLAGRSLGNLPLRPAPTASFTAEGGFKGPADFTWTRAAEEEMGERLNRLFDGNASSD